ncbi:hypothetical protein RclHR1_31270002 [Rhizophagus clarus]|uniref:Uncharacterized protein n=2 Tax=Rhizophagus clarus TaxID=94130 RepID=A0A2Z6RAK3_9GLOM|nr:hypothetical protein RclHR1_31270002 [Rhizophagus clarus]
MILVNCAIKENSPTWAVLDTGSDVNYISQKHIGELGITYHSESNRIETPDVSYSTLGKVDLHIGFNDNKKHKSIPTEFIVVGPDWPDHFPDLILGDKSLYPTLYVFRLWYRCGAPILWRCIKLKRSSTRKIFMKILCGEQKPVYCLNVTYLEISNYYQLSDKKFKRIAGVLPNIVHLDFNYSKGFSEKTLKRIAKSYPNLKYLNLQKAEEVDHNRNQTYRNIHLGKIRRLMYENYISSSSNSGCDTEITDDGLSIVVLRCRKLEYLNISHRTAITDITINAIARSCLNLKYIDLKGCYNISKEAICQLIPNVHVENIVGVSPHYISLMDKYLSQYDVCGLAELEQKIRRRNDANNLNSALMLRTIKNLLADQTKLVSPEQ